MIIHYPTAAELRMCAHIQTKLNNYKNLADDRAIDFTVDHIYRFGPAPYSPADQIKVDRANLALTNFRAGIIARNTNLGMVTEEVSKFDEKWLELPELFDTIKPIITAAYRGDTSIMKFLYVEDRKALEVGSEEARSIMLDGWLVRLASKPLIPTALTIVTTWVGQAKALVATKKHKKEDVTSDRFDLVDLKDQLFDALRKNYGELYSDNSADVRPLLAKFDTTLLKRNAKDHEKLLVNQVMLDVEAGSIASEDYNGLVPKTTVTADNRDNDFDAVIFLSILTPTGVTDYAKPVAGKSIATFDTPVIGPKYSKKINGMFTDPLGFGKIKITVKKKK